MRGGLSERGEIGVNYISIVLIGVIGWGMKVIEVFGERGAEC